MESVINLLPADRDRVPILNTCIVVRSPEGVIFERIDVSDKELITIGRNKLCEVPIDDITVSRTHCVIFMMHGVAHIMDLGSSHGTFMGSLKVPPKEATRVNDVLIFGKCKNIYILEDTSAPKSITTVDMPKARISKTVNAGESAAHIDDSRKARQDAIAAFALEMSTTAPVYKRHEVTSIRDVVDGQVIDGATVVISDTGVDGDSDDDFGPQPALNASHSIAASGSSPSTGQPLRTSSEEESEDSEAAAQEQEQEQSLDQYAVDNGIPISHQIELGGHSKAVLCLSVAPQGNRVVTGSIDYSVKMFDFGGMNSRHQAFGSFEVQSGHPVKCISHSPNGERFVVGTGSASPVVYDNQGTKVIKFIKGDMYIRDLVNTKGHTMEVTAVQWHPTDKEIILTASLDGSIRVWDLLGIAHFGDLTSKHVLKIKGTTAVQSRVGATACCYTPSGDKIIGGASDGSVHIWNERKTYSRADLVLRSSLCSQIISAVVVSPDGGLLAARALEDKCVLVWNTATLTASSTPTFKIEGMENEYPTANIDFSPNSKFLCCPSYVSTGSKRTSDTPIDKSLLCFFDLRSQMQYLPAKEFLPLVVSSPSLQIGVKGMACPIFVKWQAKINQIFCGTSAGHTIVLFDPRSSAEKKGALLSWNKTAKREVDWASDNVAVGEIINPYALPMYRNDGKPVRVRGKPVPANGRVQAPAKPVTAGPGKTPNNSFFFTQYIMQGREMDNSRAEDPREALLKLNDEASSDPKFLGTAYGKTQPVTQFAEKTFEEEQEQLKKKMKTL